MNPIAPKRSFSEYLEDKGLNCSTCLEPYGLEDNNRKPVSLGPCEHTTCIQCFKDRAFKLCPECRAEVKLDPAKITPFRAVLNQVSLAKEAWTLTYGAQQPQQAAPVRQLVAPVAPQKPIAPNNWSTLTDSVNELVFLQHSLHTLNDKIISAAPAIVKAMKWEKLAQYLSDDIQRKPNQWVYVENRDSAAPFGIAFLERKDNSYTIHWSGTTRDPNTNTDFENLITTVIQEIWERTTDENQDKISISYLFRYDDEHILYQKTVKYLLDLGLRFDMKSNPTDGKVSITFYPFSKLMYPASPKIVLYPLHLLSPIKLRQQIEQKRDLLYKKGLSTLIRVASAKYEHPEAIAGAFRDKFEEKPQEFFIYTIDNVARGFVSTNQKNALSIGNLFLLPDAAKFKRHFIEQFVNWGFTFSEKIRYVADFGINSTADELTDVANYLGHEVTTNYPNDGRQIEIYVQKKVQNS